jgi:hypothetical protein
MKALTTIALVSLLSLFSGCDDPQTTTTSTHIAQSSIEVLNNSAPKSLGKMLAIWKDVGGSQDENQFKENLPELEKGIKQKSSFIDGVQVIFYAKGNHSIWKEKPEMFIWAAPPIFKEFDEDAVMENAPPEVKAFVTNKDKYIQDARTLYEQEKKRLSDEYSAKVDSEITRLKQYLLQPLDELALCTRFISLAERIAKDNLPYNLIITDGWADCPDEQNNNIKSIEIQGKLIILQLSRGRDLPSDDKTFSQRETFLHKLFPQAEILPAYKPTEAVKALLD